RAAPARILIRSDISTLPRESVMSRDSRRKGVTTWRLQSQSMADVLLSPRVRVQPTGWEVGHAHRCFQCRDNAVLLFLGYRGRSRAANRLSHDASGSRPVEH